MNDEAAAAIVREAWRRVHGTFPSERERALVQSIARLESAYGRAPGQHARWAAQGKYTWGNLEKARDASGNCPPGWEPGSDAGNARCFLVHRTDLDAAIAFVNALTNSRWSNRNAAVREALANGGPTEVAVAMKVGAAYYEAPASTYAAAILANLKAIGAWPLPTSSVVSIVVGVTLGALAIGGLGYVAWSRGMLAV